MIGGAYTFKELTSFSWEIGPRKVTYDSANTFRSGRIHRHEYPVFVPKLLSGLTIALKVEVLAMK